MDRDEGLKRERRLWMRRLEKELGTRKLEPQHNETDIVLKRETEKWLAKLESEARGIHPTDGDHTKVQNSITNIHAYIKDSRHFMEKCDFVRAFEAVIYAWGILETCQRLGLVKK